ncbi:hypothetical protein FRC10_002962 [Ceratobasidium sp. 414]|nr:hypothetical protein FRC10_002962 [Ceratobasidium sp. 414]
MPMQYMPQGKRHVHRLWLSPIEIGLTFGRISPRTSTNSVNIMGLTKSLSIEGESNLKSYTPKNSETGEPLTSKRFFCQHCASMLWLHDPTYGDWTYPFASPIDSPLPKAENTLTIMRSSCPDYVPVPEGSVPLQKYNDQGIEEWHKSRGLWVD